MRGDVSSAFSASHQTLVFAPHLALPWQTKPSCSPLLPGERRASCGVGDQLKRARKGCIAAPAAMQRRQSALDFSRLLWDRK